MITLISTIILHLHSLSQRRWTNSSFWNRFLISTNHFTFTLHSLSQPRWTKSYFHLFGIDLLHTALDWLHWWLQRRLYFNKLVELTTVYQVLLPRQLHPFHQVRNGFIDKLFFQGGRQFSITHKSFFDQVFSSNNQSSSSSSSSQSTQSPPLQLRSHGDTPASSTSSPTACAPTLTSIINLLLGSPPPFRELATLYHHFLILKVPCLRLGRTWRSVKLLPQQKH